MPTLTESLEFSEGNLGESYGGAMAVVGGLSSLGVLSSEQTENLSKVLASMDALSGATGLILSAKALMEARNAVAVSEASAKTAVATASGVGMGNVAIALASVGVASAFAYGVVKNLAIKADPDNPADRGRISALTGVA